MEEIKKEATRVRINFKLSAKGEFQPDVTSEAETVLTAMSNLKEAHAKLNAYAAEQGFLKSS